MDDINSLIEMERLEQARIKRKSKSKSRAMRKREEDHHELNDISEQLMGDVVKKVMATVRGSNECFACGCAHDTTDNDDEDGASTWAKSIVSSVATSVATSVTSVMEKASTTDYSTSDYSTSVEDDWSDTSSLTETKYNRSKKLFSAASKIFSGKINKGTSKKYGVEPRKVFGLRERYEC